MNAFEKIEDFESQTIGTLAQNMIIWFGFDDVQMRFISRPEVASRVWIDVEIQKGKDKWFVSGQTGKIVHRRLVEWLKSHLENTRR